MKGTITAALLFAALITGIIFAQLALEKVSEEMALPLSELTDAVDLGDWERADEVSSTLRDQWEDNAIWLAMLIDHSETDLIITTLAELCQYEKYRDVPELMAQTETLRELIEHIPKKERITLENIF